jgi:hypothetical protein
MKSISLERTPKRVELLKRMGSNDKLVAGEAQEAFAAFIAPVIQQVLLQKVTSSQIYQDVEFNENDRPTIPVDLYLGTSENYIRVWAQTMPGGLPTNVVQGLQEYTFTTYELDSAIAFMKSYLRQARLDVMTAGMERMINEIAVKQERNAWGPILAAAGTASTNGQSHIIDSTIAGQFLLDDLNRLWTKIQRMYVSYVGGTPDTATPVGLTDLFVSPEVMEDIRGFAYNPMNVRGGYDSGGSEMTTGAGVPLPDAMRQRIFESGGMAEIYNVTLHSMVEFGVNQKYNLIFDNFYSGSFDPATQQVALGLDLSRQVFLRPVVVNDEATETLGTSGGQVVVRPDDQFFTRSEKVGFFAKVREGRLILDDRAIVGIII